MRVSTDPNDPAYIDDRPRRAWCNDKLVEGWTVADEFRRVIVTPTKNYYGSVLVERLPADPSAPVPVVAPQAPINTGFGGVFVHTPDKQAQQQQHRKKRR